MRDTFNNGALVPGFAAPEPAQNGETRELGGGAGSKGQGTESDLYFRSASPAEQALQAIDGEGYAKAFLARLRSHQADADQLVTLVQFLDGAMLQGACRVLCRAMEGQHHA